METETLIYEYQNVLRNQGDMKTRGGRKADRSKTVYHSRHTIKQKRRPPSTKRTVAHDMPSSETILRILRMRPGKHVRDFIHAEFEKRNHPSPPPAPVSQQVSGDDQHLLPMLPDAMLTPSDESMQRLS
jgi:hypothetical protein